MFTNLKHLSRLKHIISVFLEEGFGSIVRKAHLHHYVPFSKRLQHKLIKQEYELMPEIRLRKALERLGPTFIKFGQTLSLRPDVLPSNYITELEKMQDKVPPTSFAEIKQIIKAELGKDISEIFSKFEPTPIASASIAQVHKAKLKSGQVVAVKIQHPDVEKLMLEDIEVILLIAHWFKKHKVLPNLPLVPLVEEFRRWTLRELNFRYEAFNLKLFRQNFKDSRKIIIPKVYDEFVSDKILTLEFIDGIPLHDIEKTPKKNQATKLIREAYKALIDMIFIHGTFHADPHPGNILVTKDNRIAFVDFGIVGRFDHKLRLYTLRLLDAVLKNDYEEATEAILAIKTNKDQVNEEQLKRDIRDILDEARVETFKDIKLGPMLRETLDMVHRNNITPPVDFVLFAKTIMTLEGLGLRHSPDFKLMDEAGPIIGRIIKYEASPTRVLKRTRQHLNAYKTLLEKTPAYLTDALQKLREGKIDIELSGTEYAGLRTELEHSAGNIAIGTMTAALFISSAIIMNVVQKPEVFGMPLLAFTGFSIAVMLGIWLIKRTIFVSHKLD